VKLVIKELRLLNAVQCRERTRMKQRKKRSLFWEFLSVELLLCARTRFTQELMLLLIAVRLLSLFPSFNCLKIEI
jgi:hypothetical protein